MWLRSMRPNGPRVRVGLPAALSRPSSRTAASHDEQSRARVGVAIWRLTEASSGKSVPVPNTKPKLKTEQVDLITQCMVFLERDGATVAAISPVQIQAGNVRESFKLVWAIICRYEIDILAPCVGTCARPRNFDPTAVEPGARQAAGLAG